VAGFFDVKAHCLHSSFVGRAETLHLIHPLSRSISNAQSNAAFRLLDNAASHCERTTRSALSRKDSQMEAKFAVGDRVDQSPRDRFVGTVKAVYTTREGETRYAVDMEGHGTLRLCSEHTIVAHHH
jgi:hypothetical protein